MTGPLATLADTLKISKLWIAGMGVLFTTLFLFFGLGANLLCNLVGFLYPAYESFKAIESGNREDNVQWLIYWVVFGCFHIAEIGIEILLSWFPFYYAFKLGFLVYCFLPSTRGAQFVYGNIIKPFLETHQVRFDDAANSINEELYGSVRLLSFLFSLLWAISLDPTYSTLFFFFLELSRFRSITGLQGRGA